jgi:hypothetical protein
MKKLLLICILIIGIIFISGCIGNENNSNTETTTSSKINQESDSNQNDLKKLEHFIDSGLKNVKIESSDPNIEVIRMELKDNREYEASYNYLIHVLVQNNGDYPVRIESGVMYGPFYKHILSDSFILLKSGERMWLNPSGQGFEKLNLLSTLFINAYTTVETDISPDIGDIKINLQITDSITNSKIDWTKRQSPKPSYLESALDINSIQYEVTDDNHKWEYLTIGVNIKEKEFNGCVNVGIDTAYGRKLQKLNIRYGGIEYTKFPLEGYKARDINQIGFYVMNKC